MRTLINIFILLLTLTSCQSQTKKANTNKTVGGPCEGCEAIFEYGNQKLTSIDTLPDFDQNKPKLRLTGTVFEKDGKTPAKNVILYIYHTDRNGIYPKKGGEKGWARRHGYIRGWIKTDKTGQYTFHTFRPAAYPNGTIPEHIHVTVKEPSKNEYYIDVFAFDDDPILTSKERHKLKNRGGSGIVKPALNDGILTAKRDIVLGLNIPNYE
ncbi:intradiol ring-cleavage dioxygenase [Seonamhaeicola sp.]|uniref:dioxygenase family protein n=1 Tax=Seonamhaeicola sp. TaxID=1912245 RepID=UPI0026042FEF|nr:intradiol ring-cleavage dioxygenase [Seonamhaeicola sp.]